MFKNNQALLGSSLACYGSNVETTSRNLRFTDGLILQTGGLQSVDVWSAGGCSGSLWGDSEPCPVSSQGCQSCPTSNCGISEFECVCYCDSISAERESGCFGSDTPTPTPTPIPQSSGDGTSSTFLKVALSLLAFLLVLLVLVAAALAFLYKKRPSWFQAYLPINQDDSEQTY